MSTMAKKMPPGRKPPPGRPKEDELASLVASDEEYAWQLQASMRNEDEDEGAYELTPIRSAAAASVASAASVATTRDDGPPRKRPPRCGGCFQAVTMSEARCPSCDCPMHASCGAVVGGDEDSPFRLCVKCESRQISPRKTKRTSLLDNATQPRGKGGVRKRVTLNGHAPNVVAELMKKQPATRERLERRPSKPVMTETTQKVGILGSDYAVYLLICLVFGLFLFVVIEASLHGVKLFGSGTHDDGGSETVVVPSDSSSWKRDYDGAWYLDSATDSFLTKTYFDKMDLLTGYRDATKFTSAMFSDMCGRYQFDFSNTPSISIVVGPVFLGVAKRTKLLTVTVHSILARTPPEIVKEIIVVKSQLLQGEVKDEDLERELQELSHLSPLVRVVTVPGNTGLVRARIDAITKEATGDILVVVDAFVEVWSATWLQQLVLPVLEYPRTLSVPLSHRLTPKRSLDTSETTEDYYAVIDKQLRIQRLSSRFTGPNEQKPSSWEPYKTPFFESAVFAVRREEFLKLHLWDHGLERFGGDNLELALKYWSCHGRVIAVPCVHVGYVPISNWPLPAIPQQNQELIGLLRDGQFMYFGKSIRDDKEAIMTVRNFLRVLHVWLGNHAAKYHFYEAAFGSAILPAEWKQFEEEMDDDDSFIDEQMTMKESLQCKDFEWFDKHVLMSTTGLHNPWWVDTRPNPHQ